MVRIVPYTGGEKESLLVAIERHRDVVRWKVAGLDDEQLRRPMTPSGTSVLGLVKHLASVEYGWFCETFGRPTEALPFDEDDPDADLRVGPAESTADVLAFHDRARAAANQVVADFDLDDTGTAWYGEKVSLRWVMIHMLEEGCRHAGHLDILRELIDGRTGDHDRPAAAQRATRVTLVPSADSSTVARMAATFPFQSALVTGASSGIGEELTRQLAAAGVPVVAVARRAERLDALAAELSTVEVLVADLGDRDGQALVAERIADPERPLDLVVNNAGFGTSGAFVSLDVDRLSDEIALNVDALTRLTHAALAVMVPRGRGWVLNVSSFASFQPAPRLAVYAATKAYVTSLGESLHEEVKGAGVGVTTLCPGLVRTEFQAVSNTSHYQSEFPELLWLPLGEVVASALDATAKRRAIVVPGALYKSASWAVGVTPRWLRRVASGRVQRT